MAAMTMLFRHRRIVKAHLPDLGQKAKQKQPVIIPDTGIIFCMVSVDPAHDAIA